MYTSLLSSHDDIGLIDAQFVDEAWGRAANSGAANDSYEGCENRLVLQRTERTQWKTIRIFVSSTFKDFHHEREILVKTVFPDLRQWCMSRQLHLIDCDLRWGVPANSSEEVVLRTCLSEIDRCYKDNVFPFFLNMTSERVGWLPKYDQLPPLIRDEYEWVDGLSITEMEILHGALRVKSPNAIFMIRQSEDEASQRNSKSGEHFIVPYKMKALRKVLHEHFPGQTFEYSIASAEPGASEEMAKAEARSRLEEHFAPTILDFFKDRIKEQYPEVEKSLKDGTNKIGAMKKNHEIFCRHLASEMIPETEKYMYDILEYVNDPSADVPLFLYGCAGSGKSTLMSRWMQIMLDRYELCSTNHRVFCHFVGAVPEALNKLTLMLRLGHFFNIPKSNSLEASIARALSSNRGEKVIIFIDAINQLATEKSIHSTNWLPLALSEDARVVVSMVEGSDEHQHFQQFYRSSKFVEMTQLNDMAKRAIVSTFLGKYNKELSDEQTEILLSNKSSANPLWLSLATEELRIYGHFRTLTDKIRSLRDNLLELECQILDRFEAETSRDLLIATCSLIEAANHGLLESELLELLADESNLLPPLMRMGGEDEENSDQHKGHRLSSSKWAEVFRVLRPFIRPYGEPGEGRLDFYHRSFSKAVRIKYFLRGGGGGESDVIYDWWRSKLIGYFQDSRIVERRMEELPFLLSAAAHLDKNSQQLQNFLTEKKVIKEMYEWKLKDDFWLSAGGFDCMAREYVELAKRELWSSTHKGKNDDEKTTRKLTELLIKLCKLCMRRDQFAAVFDIANQLNSVIYDGKLVSDPNPAKVTIEMKWFVELHAEAFYRYALQWGELIEKEHLSHYAMSVYWHQLTANFIHALNGETWTKEGRKELAYALNELSWRWLRICRMNDDFSLADAKLSDRDDICQIIFTLSPQIPMNFTFSTAFCYAEKNVDEAIAIFDELEENEEKGNAITTKAALFALTEKDTEKALEQFAEAERVLNSVTGGMTFYHANMWYQWARVLNNVGRFEEAYDLYVKALQRRLSINGLHNSNTRVLIENLSRPEYLAIAAARGDQNQSVREAIGTHESDQAHKKHIKLATLARVAVALQLPQKY